MYGQPISGDDATYFMDLSSLSSAWLALKE
jgi:hypothetical protein